MPLSCDANLILTGTNSYYVLNITYYVHSLYTSDSGRLI